ncbi:MAG: acetolactate synthase large subunit [Novosphingobium sp.]|nr:acetolactate synthase large subunit [Novosphingobium sp.]
MGTLANAGVTACFANPGTSEMHLVAAIDREPRIRPVLTLFEGVATGAADGFARISGRPAMTLLHLGSGLSNGSANLHNARRARSPIINVVGDHAAHHLHHDAPLTSDVAGLAGPVSTWVRRIPSASYCGDHAAEAFCAAMRTSGPATLIVPADSAWTDGARIPDSPLERRTAWTASPAMIEQVAEAIRRASNPVLLCNGSALKAHSIASLARLEAAGVRVIADTFAAVQRRGAGLFSPPRLPYFAEMALDALAGTDLIVLCGTRAPVAFFAYPGKPSLLVPEGCETLSLATEEGDSALAAALLADALGAPRTLPSTAVAAPDAPAGALTVEAIGCALARHLPPEAVIADDSVTASATMFAQTQQAAPHDWLSLTGGAIGLGMPLALGAAVAAPERKVVALTGDGAGMYAPQALWSIAREQSDVLTIVFANRSYRILDIEYRRTGAGDPGKAARHMLTLDQPVIDWTGLARSLGVEAVSAGSAEECDKAVQQFLSRPGPALIEALI